MSSLSAQSFVFKPTETRGAFVKLSAWSVQMRAHEASECWRICLIGICALTRSENWSKISLNLFCGQKFSVFFSFSGQKHTLNDQQLMSFIDSYRLLILIVRLKWFLMWFYHNFLFLVPSWSPFPPDSEYVFIFEIGWTRRSKIAKNRLKLA